VVRPKHRDRLERFQSQALAEVTRAVEIRDLAALEAAFALATDFANQMHVESGYPHIEWVLPDEPPRGLRLEPVKVASSDEM
jgi:hypothetical protein